MEDQIIYHALPDSPISVLEMFGTSKNQINSFAAKVINEVEAGTIDPLKVKVLCKTLTEIADKIDKGTKDNQKTAAALYGEKPFDFMGAELHLTSVYTSYDYSGCNDPEYNTMKEIIERYTTQLKEREAFLKTVKAPLNVVDSDGELITINPPVKSVTEGLKVSIK
jgi:hypothetical protein